MPHVAISRRATVGRCFTALSGALVALFWLPVLALAETPLDELGKMPAAQREALSRTVRSILIESLPKELRDDQDWEAKKRVFAGLKIAREQDALLIDKQTKEVNHGLWRRIEVTPVDPEKNLRFEIVSAKSIAPNRFAFELVAAAPLHATLRVERWRMGLKMLNFKSEADTTIEMRLHGEVGFRTDWQGTVGQILLQPQLTSVDLRLLEFDLQRLGLVQGKLAEELGDFATKPLSRQLDKQEATVLAKINTALTERHDQLALKVNCSWLSGSLGSLMHSASQQTK